MMDMDDLLNVEDTKCVLIQFSNFDSKYAVGYVAWIIDKDKVDLKNRTDGTDQDIEMMWPNVDVKPSRQMKRRLNSLSTTKKLKWEKCAVKIIETGGKLKFWEIYIIFKITKNRIKYDLKSLYFKADLFKL